MTTEWNGAAATAKATGNPIVFIPLHKGADGFMSNPQFEKFYWKSLKAVMRGLAENGAIPCLFVDGGYILSIGCALDEGKKPSLQAFIDAGKEFGKY